MKFSRKKLDEARKSLDAQVEKYRDAYNQAVGGLQLLDHLESTAEDEPLSQGKIEDLLDARLESIERVDHGKHGE